MREICRQCAGRGAGTLHYRTYEPFDVWLCDCANGLALRRERETDPERLMARVGVPLDRIHAIEDIREAPAEGPANRDLLVSAGKVDRAGLGGKVKK